MTKTTTLFYTHEELNEFGITDEQMRNCGYYKKSFDTIGKVYAKVEYVKLKEQTNGRDCKKVGCLAHKLKKYTSR